MLRAAAILMTSRVRRRPRDEDGDYEVGYGKPPRYTRFKKGRSGKPERPTGGAKNLSTLLTEALKSASSSPRMGGAEKSAKRPASGRTAPARHPPRPASTEFRRGDPPAAGSPPASLRRPSLTKTRRAGRRSGQRDCRRS